VQSGFSRIRPEQSEVKKAKSRHIAKQYAREQFPAARQKIICIKIKNVII
jgi:hypothetical protein